MLLTVKTCHTVCDYVILLHVVMCKYRTWSERMVLLCTVGVLKWVFKGIQVLCVHWFERRCIECSQETLGLSLP